MTRLFAVLVDGVGLKVFDVFDDAVELAELLSLFSERVGVLEV